MRRGWFMHCYRGVSLGTWYGEIMVINEMKKIIVGSRIVFNLMGGTTLSCYINALEEISTQNGPFNFNSNSMSSCVSQWNWFMHFYREVSLCIIYGETIVNKKIEKIIVGSRIVFNLMGGMIMM